MTQLKLFTNKQNFETVFGVLDVDHSGDLDWEVRLLGYLPDV